jgi:uncharacterized protein
MNSARYCASRANTVEIPGQMMHEVLAESGAQRRTILRGGVGAAFAAAFGSSAVLSACGGSSTTAAEGTSVSYALSFKGIPAVTGNTVVVPEGYTSSVLFSAGDAVVAGATAFTGTALDSAAWKRCRAASTTAWSFSPCPA